MDKSDGCLAVFLAAVLLLAIAAGAASCSYDAACRRLSGAPADAVVLKLKERRVVVWVEDGEVRAKWAEPK